MIVGVVTFTQLVSVVTCTNIAAPGSATIVDVNDDDGQHRHSAATATLSSEIQTVAKSSRSLSPATIPAAIDPAAIDDRNSLAINSG